MRTIFCLLFTAFIIAPINAHAATSYAGIWDFTMKVAQTTCTESGSPVVGDSKTLSVEITQNKKVLSGSAYSDPPVTGVGTNYTGYLTKGGMLMSLSSSCTVTLEPLCSKSSESFVFENASKKKAKVVWLSVTRSDSSAYTCSTVYSGQAKKKAKSKK